MSSEQATPSESSDTSTVTIQVAAAPFNDPGADVVIRTSDDVHFHVHRAILSFVSPFFRDMFALPQPRSSGENPENESIPITEDSPTFDCLLRHIYPGVEPPNGPRTYAEIATFLLTMMKYQMDSTWLFSWAVRQFISITHIAPSQAGVTTLKVFGTLWKYRTSIPDDLLQAAARSIVRIPIQHLTSLQVLEMDSLSVNEFIQLLKYHKRCSEAIRKHTPKFVITRGWGVPGGYSYTCSTYTAARAQIQSDVSGENVEVLFEYMRNQEYSDCLYACADSISASLLHKAFAGRGGLACGACHTVECSAMREVISRTIRGEVDSILARIKYEPGRQP